MMNKLLDKNRKDDILKAALALLIVGLIVFGLFMFRLMFHWQKDEILKAIPPQVQAAEQPVVVKAEYTLIYKASIPTYVKEHYIKDGRIYYIKDDGKAGPQIDARLEEGYIPYVEMYNYGFIDFVEEVGGKDGK